MPRKWAYMVVETSVNHLRLPEVRAKINDLGNEGWELTGIASPGDPDTVAEHSPVVMVFKREK